MATHDAVWAALSHPARRGIVDALRTDPATTGTLHGQLLREGLSPSRFATQRHLQVLRDADLVLVAERGRERMNALNASALYQATIGWLDPASARTAHSLDSLKHRAERGAAAHQERGSIMHDFHIRQVIEIDAEPARVWEALVMRPSDWWGAPYLLLDGPSTFEMPTTAGAPLVERLGEQTALWGVVTACSPERAYAWRGQMGMGPEATGEVRYELEATETGTRVSVRHDWIHLWGEGDGMREGYDYGWADLNARLKALVETGARHGTAGTNTEPEFVFTPSA